MNGLGTLVTAVGVALLFSAIVSSPYITVPVYLEVSLIFIGSLMAARGQK